MSAIFFGFIRHTNSQRFISARQPLHPSLGAHNHNPHTEARVCEQLLDRAERGRGRVSPRQGCPDCRIENYCAVKIKKLWCFLIVYGLYGMQYCREIVGSLRILLRKSRIFAHIFPHRSVCEQLLDSADRSGGRSTSEPRALKTMIRIF